MRSTNKRLRRVLSTRIKHLTAVAGLVTLGALGLTACDDDGDEGRIEQIAETWAPLFAAAPHPGACGEFDEQDPQREVAAKYMAQPACEWLACERVATGPIKNCTPVSLASQESFADAAVEDVAMEGGRAAAKFSNGVAVEFVSDPVEQPEDELAPRWLIVKVGGNAAAEFFD